MRNARGGGRGGGREGVGTELGAYVDRGLLLFLELSAVKEALDVALNGGAGSVGRQQVVHAAAEGREGGRKR
jgi:hypothetical protein